MPFSKDNVVIIIIVIRRARNFEPIKKNDGFRATDEEPLMQSWETVAMLTQSMTRDGPIICGLFGHLAIFFLT